MQANTFGVGNSLLVLHRLINTFGTKVVDSNASNHIFGNKSLLPKIIYSQSLPVVILDNGFQTKAKGVGQANQLSLLL